MLDGKGGVLTPGLIDVESTLGVHEVSAESATTDLSDGRGPFTAGFRPAAGFDPMSVRIPITRKGGITSVVVAPEGGVLSGVGTWADLTGSISNRPTEADDVALFVTVGANGANHVGKARGALWMRLREIAEEARLLSSKARDFENRSLRELSLDPLHLRAFDRALKGELVFAVHAHKAADIAAVLDFGSWVKTTSRGKETLKIVILGGTEAWMVRDELAAAKAAVVLDPMEDGPQTFSRLRTREDAAVLLDKANVPLVLYVGGWDENARRLPQVAGNAVARGLDRNRALKAMTQTPAAIFGKTDRGVIAAGRRADVVLWSKDPFELDSVAKTVFIAGRAHSLDSRQDELARRYLRQPAPRPASKTERE